MRSTLNVTVARIITITAYLFDKTYAFIAEQNMPTPYLMNKRMVCHLSDVIYLFVKQKNFSPSAHIF